MPLPVFTKTKKELNQKIEEEVHLKETIRLLEKQVQELQVKCTYSNALANEEKKRAEDLELKLRQQSEGDTRDLGVNEELEKEKKRRLIAEEEVSKISNELEDSRNKIKEMFDQSSIQQSKEVSDLKQVIESLTKEIEFKTQQIEIEKVSKTEVQEVLSIKEGQLELRANEIEGLQREIRELQSELSKVDEYKMEISSKQNEIERLHLEMQNKVSPQDLELLEQKKQELEQEITNKEVSNNSLIAEITKLEQLIQDLQAKDSEQQKKVDDLSSNIQEWESKYENIQKQLQTAEERFSDLSDQLIKETQKTTQLEEDLENQLRLQGSKATEVATRNEELELQIQELKKTLQKRENEEELFRLEYNKLEEKLKSSEEELQQTKVILDSEQEQKRKLEEDLITAQIQLIESTKQRESEKSGLEIKLSESQQELSAARSQLDELESKIIELNSNLELVNAQLNKEKNDRIEAEERVKYLTNLAADSSKDADIVNNLQTILEETKSQLSNEQNERIRIENELNKTTTQLENNQNQITLMQQKITSLEDTLKETTLKLENEEVEKSSLSEKISQLNTALEQSQQQTHINEEELNKVKNELQILKDSQISNSADPELEGQLLLTKQTINTLRQEYDQLKVEYEKRNDLDQTIKKYQELEKQLESEKQIIEEQKSAQANEINTLRVQLLESQEQREKLVQQISEKDELISTLNKELEKLKQLTSDVHSGTGSYRRSSTGSDAPQQTTSVNVPHLALEASEPSSIDNVPSDQKDSITKKSVGGWLSRPRSPRGSSGDKSPTLDVPSSDVSSTPNKKSVTDWLSKAKGKVVSVVDNVHTTAASNPDEESTDWRATKNKTMQWISKHAKLTNELVTVNSRTLKIAQQITTSKNSILYQTKDEKQGTKYTLKRRLIGEKEERIRHEACILQRLLHPHIIELIDFEITEKQGHPEALFVYTYGDRTLGQWIQQHADSREPEEVLLRIFHEVVHAVCYLHSQTPSIIHRAIRADNVLLTNGNGKAKVVRLCHFYSATQDIWNVENESDIEALKEDVLSNTPVDVRPPETLHIVKGRKVDQKYDIWGIGCLLYHLCYGKIPFAHNLDALSGKYPTPNTKPPTTTATMQIISDCLKVVPEERPDIWNISERLAALRGVEDPSASTKPKRNSIASSSLFPTNDTSKPAPQHFDETTHKTPQLHTDIEPPHHEVSHTSQHTTSNDDLFAPSPINNAPLSVSSTSSVEILNDPSPPTSNTNQEIDFFASSPPAATLTSPPAPPVSTSDDPFGGFESNNNAISSSSIVPSTKFEQKEDVDDLFANAVPSSPNKTISTAPATAQKSPNDDWFSEAPQAPSTEFDFFSSTSTSQPPHIPVNPTPSQSNPSNDSDLFGFFSTSTKPNPTDVASAPVSNNTNTDDFWS